MLNHTKDLLIILFNNNRVEPLYHLKKVIIFSQMSNLIYLEPTASTKPKTKKTKKKKIIKDDVEEVKSTTVQK